MGLKSFHFYLNHLENTQVQSAPLAVTYKFWYLPPINSHSIIYVLFPILIH